MTTNLKHNKLLIVVINSVSISLHSRDVLNTMLGFREHYKQLYNKCTNVIASNI